MIPYVYSVRMNCPQDFLYTYKKPPKPYALIDLTNYDTVAVQFKLEGEVFDTTDAEFVSKTAGTVRLLAYELTEPGIWTAQFICTDGAGKLLPGEPVRFRVVKNVEDLDLSELPQW